MHALPRSFPFARPKVSHQKQQTTVKSLMPAPNHDKNVNSYKLVRTPSHLLSFVTLPPQDIVPPSIPITDMSMDREITGPVATKNPATDSTRDVAVSAIVVQACPKLQVCQLLFLFHDNCL